MDVENDRGCLQALAQEDIEAQSLPVNSVQGVVGQVCNADYSALPAKLFGVSVRPLIVLRAIGCVIGAQGRIRPVSEGREPTGTMTLCHALSVARNGGFRWGWLIQVPGQKPEPVARALDDRTAHVICPPHEPILVPQPMVPEQAVQVIDALHEAESVFIAYFDIDRGIDKPRRIARNDRCGVLPFEFRVVERVAKQCRDASRRADLVPIRHFVPSQARPCAGFHRGYRTKSLGILEAQPQTAETAHRNPGDHRGLAIGAYPVLRAQMRQEFRHDERLPAVLAVVAVHVDRTSSDRRRCDDHPRKIAVRPHFVDLPPEPYDLLAVAARAVQHEQQRKPRLTGSVVVGQQHRIFHAAVFD